LKKEKKKDADNFFLNIIPNTHTPICGQLTALLIKKLHIFHPSIP